MLRDEGSKHLHCPEGGPTFELLGSAAAVKVFKVCRFRAPTPNLNSVSPKKTKPAMLAVALDGEAKKSTLTPNTQTLKQ